MCSVSVSQDNQFIFPAALRTLNKVSCNRRVLFILNCHVLVNIPVLFSSQIAVTISLSISIGVGFCKMSSGAGSTDALLAGDNVDV
jgi:hypothetical protein